MKCPVNSPKTVETEDEEVKSSQDEAKTNIDIPDKVKGFEYAELFKNDKFVKNDNFRLLFVSQKLEYTKPMLDTCILVSVDEDRMRKEEQRIKLRRRNQRSEKVVQKELEFIEACFEGNLDKVTSMLGKYPVSANSNDLHGNTALMEAALKGHVEIVKK